MTQLWLLQTHSHMDLLCVPWCSHFNHHPVFYFLMLLFCESSARTRLARAGTGLGLFSLYAAPKPAVFFLQVCEEDERKLCPHRPWHPVRRRVAKPGWLTTEINYMAKVCSWCWELWWLQQPCLIHPSAHWSLQISPLHREHLSRGRLEVQLYVILRTGLMNDTQLVPLQGSEPKKETRPYFSSWE